jgi:hypothetical protein
MSPFIAPRLGAKTVESIWTEAASSDLTLCPRCEDVAEPVAGGKRQCISCYHTFTPAQKTAAADPSSPEYKEWLDNQSWDPTAPVGQQRGLSEIFPPVEMDTSEYKTSTHEWDHNHVCLDCGGDLHDGPKGLVHYNGDEHCPLSIVHPKAAAAAGQTGHTFGSTSEAYNRSQTDDKIKHGDILHVRTTAGCSCEVSHPPGRVRE